MAILIKLLHIPAPNLAQFYDNAGKIKICLLIENLLMIVDIFNQILLFLVAMLTRLQHNCEKIHEQLSK